MRLSNDDYERIKGAVADLFASYSVTTIPIDMFGLARKMGIVVLPYSSSAAILSLLGEGDAPDDGFKTTVELGGWFSFPVIFYNDEMPKQRIRFTILHEIGHIVLGHRQSSDLAEAEANFFAKYAIAPPVLVRVIRPVDYIDIACAFDISRECAFNSMLYYVKWLRLCRGNRSYEDTLENLFTFERGGDRILRMKKGA